MKSKREKPKCDYFIGSDHEKYFFRRNMEIMTKLLEEKNIDVPDFARRGKLKPSLKQEDGKHLYDLGARVKRVFHISVSYISISDLQSDIFYSDTSISSLEETQNSSPKFPPKTSHFH